MLKAMPVVKCENVENYRRHIKTIALLQLLAPNKNNSETSLANFNEFFGDASPASNNPRDSEAQLKIGAGQLAPFF